MKTWLVVDSNYVCHRAFHSIGNLTFGDYRTGTLFGFLKTLLELDDLFVPDRHIFCFDAGASKRKAIYPQYKSSRREARQQMDDEAREAYQQMQKQIRLLRFELLDDIGYRNVFCETGYEADDLIASVAHNRPKGVKIIIVGADHDLYQLLAEHVVMFDLKNKRAYDRHSFRQEWGIDPRQWADVKAIAGCSGDDVEGIRGIGEKTAAKFLSGQLKPGKKYSSIVEGNDVWRRNLPLVSLPFEDTPVMRIRSDRVTYAGWKSVCRKYGFKSLVRQINAT